MGGGLHAIVHVEDEEGRELPRTDTVFGFDDMGRELRLSPGEAFVVHGTVITEGVERLPPGQYLLKAALHRYDLTASADLSIT